MSSQKEDIDADPARQLHSNEKSKIDQQQRFYKVYADIGELILAFISGEVFHAAFNRMAMLAGGLFIPCDGYGSLSVVAGLLGLKEDGARALLKRNNVPFKKPGQDQMYRLADVVEKFEPANEV